MNRELLLVALGGLCGVSCAATGSSATWTQQTALVAADKLGGCAIGDVDPTRPGNEIVAVSASGEVYEIYREGGVWGTETIASLPGEMIQCAVGDIDPQHPGDEVVTVGMQAGGETDGGAGVAWYFYRSADAWHSEELFVDSALLHAVCIGDLDPDRIGNEVLVAGYSKRAHVFAKNGEQWQHTPGGELPGEAKGAAVARGGGVIACADGSVVLVRKGGDGFSSGALKRFGAGLARVAGVGSTIVVCDNRGDLNLLDRSGALAVHVDDERLRGAVFLPTDQPGALRLATTGYGQKVFSVDWDPQTTSWTVTEIGSDGAGLHHLAYGVLPDFGPALVTVGYSGSVIVLTQDD